MKEIKTDDHLTPKGHYAQAIEHNGVVYISGILPFDADSGEVVEHNLEKQCNAVFSNLDRVLKAAGTDKNHVLKTTVCVPDVALWLEVNSYYADYFKEHRPARMIVPTNTLHYNALIELEAIAYIG